jgi:hypothetical protein
MGILQRQDVLHAGPNGNSNAHSGGPHAPYHVFSSPIRPRPPQRLSQGVSGVIPVEVRKRLAHGIHDKHDWNEY